ncbi:hypothetical protein ACFOY2_40975 [Nonomuraea purpurea]|uniref:Zinc transporter permease n=1 Tax=Nonomuraea purpurea TaxID=1849276 RepID=A0ABV8GLG5_9ACTN
MTEPHQHHDDPACAHDTTHSAANHAEAPADRTIVDGDADAAQSQGPGCGPGHCHDDQGPTAH